MRSFDLNVVIATEESADVIDCDTVLLSLLYDETSELQQQVAFRAAEPTF